MADPIKQYVNLDPTKPNELKEIKSERAGRVIKISATINKKVEGVPVMFEIVLNKNNLVPSLDENNFSKKELAALKKKMQGINMPGKAKRRAITDADGKATIEFTLSTFGGDEFEVKAYLKKRGGKKSKELVSDKYVVWKRIYYQVSRFRAGKVGAGWKGSLPEIPNFDWEPVRKEFENRQHNIELVDNSSQDLIKRRCNVLVNDADYKKSAKEGYDSNREPVTMRAVLVNMIATAEEKSFRYTTTSRGQVTIRTSKPLWKDESLQVGTDCVIDAEWRFAKGKDKSWTTLDRRYIYGVAPFELTIRFDLMPEKYHKALFGASTIPIKIKLKLRYLDGSTNGVSWYNAIWLANTSMWIGPRTDSDKQSTTIHETGHFIDMVPSSQTSTWYEDHGHTGPHCSQGLNAKDKLKSDYSGLNGTCVMFGESTPTRKNKFCSDCDPSVRKSGVRIKYNMPKSW